MITVDLEANGATATATTLLPMPRIGWTKSMPA